MGPIHLLNHIGHLIVETSNSLGPGIVLSIPCLSHPPLGLVNLPYEQLCHVLGVVPRPLDQPQHLTKIPTSPQQESETPFRYMAVNYRSICLSLTNLLESIMEGH